MWKKISIMSLVLAMVLSFAACEKESISVEAIVDGVTEALDDIKTQQFDMDMTMDMSGEAGGESFEMAMVMESSGVADFENREMMMDMTMNMVKVCP